MNILFSMKLEWKLSDNEAITYCFSKIVLLRNQRCVLGILYIGRNPVVPSLLNDMLRTYKIILEYGVLSLLKLVNYKTDRITVVFWFMFCNLVNLKICCDSHNQRAFNYFNILYSIHRFNRLPATVPFAPPPWCL